MNSFPLDVAHMLAGGMVLVSFMLLYQDRMFALLNVFALHAVVLSASVTSRMRRTSTCRRRLRWC
jgi:hydrogenase-4 component E